MRVGFQRVWGISKFWGFKLALESLVVCLIEGICPCVLWPQRPIRTLRSPDRHFTAVPTLRNDSGRLGLFLNRVLSVPETSEPLLVLTHKHPAGHFKPYQSIPIREYSSHVNIHIQSIAYIHTYIHTYLYTYIHTRARDDAGDIAAGAVRLGAGLGVVRRFGVLLGG